MGAHRSYRIAGAVLLLGAFYLAFIYAYEVRAHDKQESDVEQYAKVAAASLWNFEPEAPATYLALIARQGNYDRLLVTTSTGETFVDVRSSEPRSLDGFLIRTGLIPLVEFHSDILHGEEVIGHLTAVWRCRVVYVCFYSLFVAALLFEIFWLYQRLLAANRGLEQRVEERTEELRQANIELSEREARMVITLHSIGDAVIATDTAGRITRINPAAQKLLGWREISLEGLQIEDVFRPLDIITREANPNPVKRVLETGNPYTSDEDSLIQSKDRNERLVACNCAPILNLNGSHLGAVLVLRDVTESYRKDLALRESEERYRSLTDEVLDGSAVGIFIVDADFQVIWSNHAIETYLGLKRAEVIGQDIRDVVLERFEEIFEDPHTLIDPLSASYSMESHIDRIECHVSAGDGRKARWLEYQSRPIHSGLYTGGRIEHYYDITGRKRAEDERHAIETQMQHTQKLESLGVLAGGIAHDFNNLLQGVMGNADLALMDIGDGHPAREYLSEIITISERAAGLCQQMLAYSGRGKFVIRAINLSELVRDMSELLEVSISKRVKLSYEFRGDLPAVEVDLMQIRQVVMNVITNASDSLDGGTGNVWIRTGLAQRTPEELGDALLGEGLPGGDYVYFEVQDDGCGMTHETLKRVFEPFYTSKATGRGPGLAAVSGIVRGHRGVIELRSEPGEGTLFRVLLPAANVKAGPLDSSPDQEEPAMGNETVLLVDDEETVLRLGRRILERAGYRVLTASEGQECVSIYQARGNEIDVVVLDMTMPGMNGEEAYHELKKLNPAVSVILSSGFNEQETLNAFDSGGAAAFIKKPYRSVQLTATLKKVIHHHRLKP